MCTEPMSTNINLLKALSQILFSAIPKQFPMTSCECHMQARPADAQHPGAQLLPASAVTPLETSHTAWPRAAPERILCLCPFSFLFTELPWLLMTSPCLGRALRSRGHVGALLGWGELW